MHLILARLQQRRALESVCPQRFAQLAQRLDRRTALRILVLVEAILRDPYDGLGKPEPLKYLGVGVWSRRITQEHRLVYVLGDDRVDILQARYHYA